MPLKVTASVPRALKTTAAERDRLKREFKATIREVVKPHGDLVESDITNVGSVIADIVVTGAAPRKRGAKRKAGKKK